MSVLSRGGGCDMLLVQASHTRHGCKLFTKNTDLPNADKQYLQAQPARQHQPDSQVQCTYIGIPQVPHTYAWSGSKPTAQWGVEMGANEWGLVVGSVALASRLRDPTDRTQRLIDIDVNRLVLERARTAEEGLDVACQLISTHGQGGSMTPNDPNTVLVQAGDSYDSAYLISDNNVSWLLETTECYWAARPITEPWFNIANHMTIGTDYSRLHAGVQRAAVDKDLWPAGTTNKFNWAEAVGLVNPLWQTEQRRQGGQTLIQRLLQQHGLLDIDHILQFVRNRDAQICRCMTGPVATVSAMISSQPPAAPALNGYFYTTTPDPSLSMYKPLYPAAAADTAGMIPEALGAASALPIDDAHLLYRLHNRHVIGAQDPSAVVTEMHRIERDMFAEYFAAVAGGRLPDNAARLCHKYTDREIQLYERAGTSSTMTL